MDRKTRKIVMMNRTYGLQSGTDRLYIPRKEGERCSVQNVRNS